MKLIKAVAAAIIILSVFGCCSTRSPGHVDHVVLVWLKDSRNNMSTASVIDATKELKAIEQVVSLKVGTAIHSERAIVDDSFDVGIVMTFHSQEDMESYLNDPRHVKKVKDVFGPLSKKILVYDINY